MAPTGPLGVVVFGTGFGCFTHVRALRNAGFEVRAVVGRDGAKTDERARQFGVPLGLTSLSEALSLPGVDAVTVATPPHTHAEIVLAAVSEGKHIICEKPFATDASEGRRMLAAVEDAGVVHLLGTEFRWDPGQATLARAIASGAIGEPRLATFILHVGVLADASAEVPDWWADAASGGGWLGAHGSQVIDQIRVTLGEIDSVSASLPHLSERAMTAEDGFVVHFRLCSGAVGVIQSTSGDWGPPLIVTRVSGSAGTAWIDGLGATVLVADHQGTREVPVGDDLITALDAAASAAAAAAPEPVPRDALRTTYERMIAHGLDLVPYTRLAERFRDLILGRPVPDTPLPATFADGVAGMEVLDAIRRSAAEQAWVRVGDGHSRSRR